MRTVYLSKIGTFGLKIRQSGCGTGTNQELVQPHKADSYGIKVAVPSPFVLLGCGLQLLEGGGAEQFLENGPLFPKNRLLVIRP
jgi:hypothetical protein